MIKNLNQLRRTLREGTQLEILDHCRPECIGQIRNITLVNTQGFYSTVENQPDASANRGNGGLQTASRRPRPDPLVGQSRPLAVCRRCLQCFRQ